MWVKQDCLLNILLPLLTGILLYFIASQVSLTGFARNQLPDGLWAYALISCLLIIWNRQINIFWISLIFITFLLFEALQHFHFIRGTGDWLDIIIYISFSIITLFTNKFFISLPKK